MQKALKFQETRLRHSYFQRLEKNLKHEPADTFLASVIDDCGSLFYTAPSKQSAVIDVLLKAQTSDDVLLTCQRFHERALGKEILLQFCKRVICSLGSKNVLSPSLFSLCFLKAASAGVFKKKKQEEKKINKNSCIPKEYSMYALPFCYMLYTLLLSPS